MCVNIQSYARIGAGGAEPPLALGLLHLPLGEGEGEDGALELVQHGRAHALHHADALLPRAVLVLVLEHDLVPVLDGLVDGGDGLGGGRGLVLACVLELEAAFAPR